MRGQAEKKRFLGLERKGEDSLERNTDGMALFKKVQVGENGQEGSGRSSFCGGKSISGLSEKKRRYWPVTISSTVGLLVLFSMELSGDFFGKRP